MLIFSPPARKSSCFYIPRVRLSLSCSPSVRPTSNCGSIHLARCRRHELSIPTEIFIVKPFAPRQNLKRRALNNVPNAPTRNAFDGSHYAASVVISIAGDFDSRRNTRRSPMRMQAAIPIHPSALNAPVTPCQAYALPSINCM